MNRKKFTWVMWGFWFSLTFAPLIVTTLMIALGLGFKIGVWVGTMLLALFGFFKAQQAVVKLRSLDSDAKIEKWLAAIRKKRTARRLKAVQHPEDPGYKPVPIEQNWELSRGWSQFRRHAFWWEIKKFTLARHVGDLFYLLGLSVQWAGTKLFVNGDTLIAVINDGTKNATKMADELHSTVLEKAACRTGILISPLGFRMRTYRKFEDAPLILLDASNLARLSRRYIG